jgi:hypothetical protein
VGAATGIAVGLQFDGFTKVATFIPIYLVLSEILRRWFGDRRGPRRVYATTLDPHLGKQVLASLTLWGVPMAIAFSGITILQTTGRPALLAIMVGVVIIVSAIASALLGAVVYLTRRVELLERDRRE